MYSIIAGLGVWGRQEPGWSQRFGDLSAQLERPAWPVLLLSPGVQGCVLARMGDSAKLIGRPRFPLRPSGSAD